MVSLEVLVAVLVVLLLIVVSALGYIGALGALGVVRFVRCSRCGHLGLTSTRKPIRPCSRCRHGVLLHPVRSLHSVPIQSIYRKHHSGAMSGSANARATARESGGPHGV